MKWFFKVDGEIRKGIMPEVYYVNRDNKHKYIINMLVKVHGIDRALILVD